MSKILQRSINALLVLAILLTSMSGICITTHAAETSVEIVSFVRGSVNDLRSSELLEARVTGYNGNISDLTFTWDNQVGTYLYAYNSSNMYNIKDTAGEVEIKGCTYLFGMKLNEGDKFSGKGYAWASVYGAELSMFSLYGTITVTVTDKNGNVIGKDSYTSFAAPSLQSDLEKARHGAFEGEKISLKDMLGRSSIVHIDCKECIVGEASTQNNDIIKLENSNGEYFVTGLKSGIASVSLTISKDNCKFHQYSGSCKISNEIYVFKKPVTSTTTTTLTLTNLDPKCEYFIDGIKGTVSGDKIVFTGLTPDTYYEVMVRGNYHDGYAYAYVADTTKTVHRATVNFYTDNVLSDTLEYYGISGNLLLKEKDSNEYIALTRSEKGKYTADVSNGVYYIYYKNGSYERIGEYQITINNENNELNIHTYSLRYDANGGTFSGKGGVYSAGDAAYVSDVKPTRSGYTFLYWTDAEGKQYKPGQLITDAISKPYVLTAQWENAIGVKVNVTIDHGQDNAADDDVSFYLVKMVNGMGIPVTNEYTLSANSHEGYNYTTSGTKAIYTATAKTFDGEAGATYSVACGKSGYELSSVTSKTDANGNIVFDVVLNFAPNNFNLEFNVEMDKDVPSYLYPAGVAVQVTYWGYDSENKLGWHIIGQHKDGTFVPVGFDAQGKGTGSYPVWQLWSNENQPYYYSIEVVSYILADGTIVTNDADAFTNTVAIVNGGGIPTYPDGSNTEHKGAYYADGKQNGTPVATISISHYDLTFDANGGKIGGENTLTLEKQVVIPDTLNYVPTREGGYLFNGWYTDKACTVKAVDGTRLTGNTTLYAGWKEPLSISGTITIDGFYLQDNVQVNVLDVDRAKNLVTTLQIMRNGTYNDYASVDTKLEYVNNVATVTYNFDEIADVGVEYRIKTALINYDTTYNNNGDNTFAENEYVALFDSSRNAKVDAKLTFNADEYSQAYKIDATLIGEGYRPTSGRTQILFQTTGLTPPNTVISQHEVAPYGEKLNFVGGISTGNVTLWKGISNGAISSYQLKLVEVDNKEYTYESPYTVRYGAVTNWDVINNEADVLQATLVPKEYAITFDLNTTDEVGNMSDFLSVDGQRYFTTHKWSYDTPINATPTRDGYVFVGWKAEKDGVYEDGYVKGSVAEPITLKAVWAEFKWVTDTDTGYFVNSENNKEAVVRFLFDVETTDDLKNSFKETGIKFIKSANIAEAVGASLTKGSLSTFYGDITQIPESSADTTYYAIGYVVCNDQTYWSLPVECKPNFNDLIIYE